MWMKSDNRLRYEKQEREKEVQRINELLEWDQDSFMTTELESRREKLKK